MPQYQRVIPRDLFNESKLLKGLGRLCLLIHEGQAPSSLKVVYDGEPFDIRQYADDGSLYAANLSVVRTGEDEIELDLRSPYNRTSPYPLLCHTSDSIHPVFTDDGLLNPEFVWLCDHATKATGKPKPVVHAWRLPEQCPHCLTQLRSTDGIVATIKWIGATTRGYAGVTGDGDVVEDGSGPLHLSSNADRHRLLCRLCRKRLKGIPVSQTVRD